MPLDRPTIGAVGADLRHVDHASSLLAVAPVLAKPRADLKLVAGIDAEVAEIEEGVHVRAQQKAVVEADRPDGSRSSPR